MPDYDFTSLSPSDFEILMRDLLAAKYDLHFEAFAQGADGGVDLRAFDKGKKFIVQCKHYSGSKFSDLKRAATKERQKMEKEQPDRYLFATTQNLTRGQKDELFKELDGLLVDPSEILCRTDINELLSLHSKVEKNHFKLWLASTGVLERIVNSGIWERSEALMESVQSRVRLYVSNASYQRAADLLDETHMVAITGAPGVGKSMLADMLLLTHWEEGWQVVTINDDLDDGWTAWKRDQLQIFLFDDFLGQTDISERRAKNEGASLSRFVERVMASNNKRLVLTTRSHVLQQAQVRDEPLARSGIDARQCVVEVRDFNFLQRSHLLYNHLYFSHLNRAVVRDFAKDMDRIWELIRHANFTPRIVELILRRPHESGEALASSLRRAFDHPLELWGPSFESALSETARFILLSLVTFPVHGADESSLRQMAIRESSPIEYNHALKALEGSWISIQVSDHHHNQPKIVFANPSCRDFVLSFLDATPDYISLLLGGSISVQQICMLLSYSIAESPDPPYRKFSGLRLYIKQNADAIYSRLQSVWQNETAADFRFNGITAALATLIHIDSEYKLKWRSWILEAIFETARTRKQVYGYFIPEFSDAKDVVEFINVELSDKVTAVDRKDECALWVDLWIDSATSDDEWLEIKSFASERSDGPIAQSCDIDRDLIVRAQQWFESELDDLESAFNKDVESMEYRIDEIRNIGSRLNLGSKIEDEATRAYERLSEIDSPSEGGVDHSPRAAEEAFDRSAALTQSSLSSVPTNAQTKAVVENLFMHLQ